jgi:hypothetical protein
MANLNFFAIFDLNLRQFDLRCVNRPYQMVSADVPLLLSSSGNRSQKTGNKCDAGA